MTDSTFDLLVAVPAPTASAALTGPYSVVTLEFPGNSGVAGAINTIFSLNSVGPGQFSSIAAHGHTPSLANGAPTTQSINGGTLMTPAAAEP